MIKFLIAALWVSAVTAGAAFWSAQPPASGTAQEADPPLLGGLDYVKTEVIPVPVLGEGTIQGYFLARLIYTVEPKEMKRLSVPAETLITDQVYTYLYGNPHTDFTAISKLDVGALRDGIRDGINKRLGFTFVHEVMIDQIDFLSKNDIRDNAIRRRTQSDKPVKGANKVPSPASHH